VKASAGDCVHLSVDNVLEIHTAVIEAFGGAGGVRDSNLLQSAVAAPQASIGGESAFSDLIEIAAAYLFYLCRNHPFVDGNKRTAMAAAIVFLRLNGIEPSPDSEEWERLVFEIADSKLDRLEATARFRKVLRKKGPRAE
jgi:death-on-curing protein